MARLTRFGLVNAGVKVPCLTTWLQAYIWWIWRGSNTQPLPCKGSFLPLKYRPIFDALPTLSHFEIDRPAFTVYLARICLNSTKDDFLYIRHSYSPVENLTPAASWWARLVSIQLLPKETGLQPAAVADLLLTHIMFALFKILCELNYEMLTVRRTHGYIVY